MKIKTATLLGIIGTTITLLTYIVYILINTDVISLVNDEWDYDKQQEVYRTFNIIMNILGAFSSFTLMLFFLTLHKNQK